MRSVCRLGACHAEGLWPAPHGPTVGPRAGGVRPEKRPLHPGHSIKLSKALVKLTSTHHSSQEAMIQKSTSYILAKEFKTLPSRSPSQSELKTP